MCGTYVHWMHLAIGGLLVFSTYYDMKLPLYLLGFGAIAIHTYKLLFEDYALFPVRTTSLLNNAQRASATSCNSCGGGN